VRRLADTAAEAGNDGLDGHLILLAGAVEASAERLINLTTAATTRADRRVHGAGGTTTLIAVDDG
jgi:hypothetical protein